MLRTDTMLFQSSQMHLGSVTPVVLETIDRALFMQLVHETVPRHLGDARGCRDTGRGGIPVDKWCLWNGREHGKGHGVGQKIVGRWGEPRDGPFHGKLGGTVNIELID